MKWFFAMWSGLSGIAKWLLKHPSFGVLVIMSVPLLMHQFVIDPKLRGERDAATALQEKAEGELMREQAVHAQIVAQYRQRAAEAAAADAANLLRVRGEQDTITQEISDDYQAKLAAARNRAAELDRRLRIANTPARTDPGSGSGAPVSGLSASTERTAEAAAQERFSDAGMSLSDRLLATEQAIQLNALIDWVEAQSQVEPGNDHAGQ